MTKLEAIRLLGGTPSAAAAELGITVSAISQWPDELTKAIENRVLASQARKHLPPELIGSAPHPEA